MKKIQWKKLQLVLGIALFAMGVQALPAQAEEIASFENEVFQTVSMGDAPVVNEMFDESNEKNENEVLNEIVEEEPAPQYDTEIHSDFDDSNIPNMPLLTTENPLNNLKGDSAFSIKWIKVNLPTGGCFVLQTDVNGWISIEMFDKQHNSLCDNGGNSNQLVLRTKSAGEYYVGIRFLNNLNGLSIESMNITLEAKFSVIDYELVTPPYRTLYYAELHNGTDISISIAGMTLKALYSDGTSEIVNAKNGYHNVRIDENGNYIPGNYIVGSYNQYAVVPRYEYPIEVRSVDTIKKTITEGQTLKAFGGYGATEGVRVNIATPGQYCLSVDGDPGERTWFLIYSSQGEEIASLFAGSKRPFYIEKAGTYYLLSDCENKVDVTVLSWIKKIEPVKEPVDIYLPLEIPVYPFSLGIKITWENGNTETVYYNSARWKELDLSLDIDNESGRPWFPGDTPATNPTGYFKIRHQYYETLATIPFVYHNDLSNAPRMELGANYTIKPNEPTTYQFVLGEERGRYRLQIKSAGECSVLITNYDISSRTSHNTTGNAEIEFIYDSTYSGNGLRILTTEKATISINKLPMPTLKSVTTTENGVKAEWDAIEGAGYYRLYYKTASEGWKKAGDTKATSFTVTGLENGKEYFFTVRCLNEDRSGFWSSFDSEGKSIVYRVELKTPVLSSVSNVQNGVSVKWKAVTGATNYRVYRKTVGGSWTKIGDTNTCSYVDETAKSGVTYIYTVRCLSKDGSKLLSAYDKNGLQVTYVAMPEITSLNNSAKGMKLTWGAVTGTGAYRVYRKCAGESWKKITDVTGLTYIDTTVESGKEYIYSLRCVSEDGSQVLSAYNTAGWKQYYLATPKPVSVSVTAAGGQVTFKWNAVTGAKGYYVYRKVSGGSWERIKTISGGSKVSYVDKTVVLGKTYYYTVRSYADGVTSSYDTAGLKITAR